MKIIVGVSHVDHGLTAKQVEYIEKLFAGRDAFFLETIELPKEVGTVPCGLYGPVMGDDPIGENEVKYIVRGNRRCTSRVKADNVISAGMRETNKLTVIAGPAEHNGEKLPCVLYTAYGGPAAPREPGDTTIPTWEGVQEARKFWAEHCLVE